MQPKHVRCKAFTLVEIMVVAFLAMVLFGSSMIVFRSSTMHVQKGTEMLDAQALLDRIEHVVRRDIRRLRRLLSCTATHISFILIDRGQEVQVEYIFDRAKKSLQRRESRGESLGEASSKNRILGEPGKVEECRFACLVTKEVFERLDLLLQINTDRRTSEPNSNTNTRLTVASQYTSRCREAYKPWERIH